MNAAFPSALTELPGRVPSFVSATVSVHMWWPAPWLLVTRIEGHLDEAAARSMARSLRAHGAIHTVRRFVGFHDWTAMTDYDGAARVLLTDVAREFHPRSDGVHVLVSSPLVAFGIRTASVVLPNVHSYPSRAHFEKALTSMLRTGGP